MKLTLVIVVYKTKIKDSTTYCSLLEALKENNGNFGDLSIVIYDNSPIRQSIERPAISNVDIVYHHDSRNLGIAAAYNYAWSIAQKNGSDWLILLDHDTQLTSSYINEILHLQISEDEVAAIVPKIISENTMISPVFSHSVRPLQNKRPQAGLQEEPVMAINSGTLIKTQFLNEIGGFNEEFPLDYLDHWLFFEIYARGRKVFVIDSVLEHELSVMDYSRVSLSRYQSIIESEINFYKNYKKDLLLAYKKQLAKRFLKQLLKVKNKKIAMYTLRKLFSF
ncbi:glycosyltransferase [Neobacillus muris]|uniref:glycosyltransferase n=1 Tax=Neobacillus muris TaxID=2941334 RepID=UPI00203EC04B|nr:glycosyltransferase [Neobacillus muris]